MASSSKKEVKKLYLSSDNKMLSGVCGGIAEYFDADPTLVRLGWVIASIMTGLFPGLLGYIIAAVVMPEKSDK